MSLSGGCLCDSVIDELTVLAWSVVRFSRTLV